MNAWLVARARILALLAQFLWVITAFTLFPTNALTAVRAKTDAPLAQLKQNNKAQ
jgi:hypothetical protein